MMIRRFASDESTSRPIRYPIVLQGINYTHARSIPAPEREALGTRRPLRHTLIVAAAAKRRRRDLRGNDLDDHTLGRRLVKIWFLAAHAAKHLPACVRANGHHVDSVT